MKYIFLVNPTSGKGKKYKEVLPLIENYCDSKNLDYVIYITQSKEDAIEYIKDIASLKEQVRLYACGGDGTLYDVVNGVFGHDNIEIGAFPLGSGNDFVRFFDENELFLDIQSQVNANAVSLDLIKCGNNYAINQCSMGLDAEICAKQYAFKKIPFINGELAYMIASVFCLLRRSNNDFTITIDDEKVIKDRVLFAVCANSRYYGGGFKCAPLAEPDDGLIDCVIIKKDMSTLRLLPLLNEYKRGNHLSWDRTIFTRAKKIKIQSEKIAAVNIDGESRYVNECEVEIIPKAIKFLLPSKCSFFY